MIVDIGACAAAGKETGHPDNCENLRLRHQLRPKAVQRQSRQQHPCSRRSPSTGPNTPPDPPELIVIDVVKIFSNANDSSSETPKVPGVR